MQQNENVIEDFRIKAKEFWVLWSDLEQNKNVVNGNPKLQAEYDQIINDGLSIRTKVEFLTAAIDKISSGYDATVDWFKSAFDLEGVNPNQYMHMNGLGLAPLVGIGGIAVVAAATTAIANWTLKAVKMQKRLHEIKRLQSEGATREEAYRLVEKAFPSDKGFFGGSEKLIYPIALGLIGLYLYSQR